MSERGAASALPLLLLSLLVLGRALLGNIAAAPKQWLAPRLVAPIVAALAVGISAVLLRRRGVEEACFTAVSSSYSSPGEVIAETKWLEEALRRVSKEGGHVRAVYEDGTFRVCVKARDASRLVGYLREFSSSILIIGDYGSSCRRVLFHRLEGILPKYLVGGSVVVLAKHYGLENAVLNTKNTKIIDTSRIININKKIIKIINEISSLQRSGFKIKRLIFVDLVEAEPLQLYNMLKARGLLPPEADCIALINSIEQQILTG